MFSLYVFLQYALLIGLIVAESAGVGALASVNHHVATQAEATIKRLGAHRARDDSNLLHLQRSIACRHSGSRCMQLYGNIED